MKLQTLQTWSFRLFVISIAFSFQPVIDLGKSNGLNVEIGAVQIVGVLFALSMLPAVWSGRARLRQNRLIWLLSLIGLSAVGSIALSGATSRSLSLAMYTLFLMVQVVSCAVYVSGNEVQRRIDAMKALVLVAGFSAGFGLWQFIGDGFGASQAVTRLLPEYTSVVFGFARPQALMAEPQYLAGLLVVGIGATFILQQIKPTRTSWLTSGMLWLVLWLTLSRGGFIAVAIAALVITIVGRHQSKVMAVAKKQLYVAMGSLVFALALVGWAGQQYAADNQDFAQSIQRYVEHVSLSVIDFPDPSPSVEQSPAAVTTQAQATKTTEKTISSNIKDTAGEIEASRIGRQQAVELGLEVATKTPSNFLFGVGMGGFGAAANEIDQQYATDIVVNNQYVNTLVETGFVGLVLWLTFIVGLSKVLYVRSKKTQLLSRQSTLLLGIFLAVHVQYLFFSTLTNATYVWLLYGLVLGQVLAKKPE